MMAKTTRRDRRRDPNQGPSPSRRRMPGCWLAPEPTRLEARAMLSFTAAVTIPVDATLAPPTWVPVAYGPQPAADPGASASAPATPQISDLLENLPNSPAAPSWQASPVQLLRGPGRQSDATHPDPGWGATPPVASDAEPKQGPGRVELAAATLRAGGSSVPEVVVADRDGGTIAVSVGGKTFNYSAQVALPEAVTLADLNGDGVPDLIVAKSGDPGQAGSLLVFLGQAGGGFNPSPRSFAVGEDPTGITVGHVDGTSTLDIVVANTGSDSVSFLFGQGQGQDWTLNQGGSILLPPGSRPVGAALVYLPHDVAPDLLICNSGTDTVMALGGLGNGQFDVSSSKTFNVGADPAEVLVGRFDRRPGLDVVTVNSGSNDLTFISGAFGGSPTTTTLTSGGTAPDAAFAVDLGQGGSMSLVVANGGDGRVALLQPALDGMDLAGVISQPGLPSITALAPGEASAAGLDLYAATAGLAAASILHFDLGTASSFLPVPATGSPVSAADAELVAQLTSAGDSPLDLVAILWNGGGGDAEGRPARGSALGSAFYSRTEGQGGEEGDGVATLSDEPSPGDEGGPAPVPGTPADPSSWLRFVLGLEERRAEFSDEPIEPLAAGDSAAIRGDRPFADRAGLALRTADPDAEAASGAVDEALRSLWSDGDPAHTPDPDPDPDRRAGPAGDRDLRPAREARLDAHALEAGSEIGPVVSSALIAARLILKASPPRPPACHKASRRPARFVALPAGPS